MFAFAHLTHARGRLWHCIQRSYKDYNWSALTTVISFTATNLSQVVAMARAHDVRVIQGVMYTEHGQPSARFNTSRLEDPAYTAQWVAAAVLDTACTDICWWVSGHPIAIPFR